MTAKKRILVQWIGHRDLRALAAKLPAVRVKKILDPIYGAPVEEENLGQTKHSQYQSAETGKRRHFRPLNLTLSQRLLAK